MTQRDHGADLAGRQSGVLAEPFNLAGPAGPWGVLLSLFGVVVLLRRLRSIAALLVVLWVSDVLFSSWINPMGMEDRQTGLITTLCTVIFLGVAGASVGRWMVREMREWGAAVAIFVAVVGLCSPAM